MPCEVVRRETHKGTASTFYPNLRKLPKETGLMTRLQTSLICHKPIKITEYELSGQQQHFRGAKASKALDAFYLVKSRSIQTHSTVLSKSLWRLIVFRSEVLDRGLGNLRFSLLHEMSEFLFCQAQEPLIHNSKFCFNFDLRHTPKSN